MEVRYLLRISLWIILPIYGYECITMNHFLDLLAHEDAILERLEDYVHIESMRLNYMKITQEWKGLESLKNESHVFGHNPLETFQTIRHLTASLNEIGDLITEDIHTEILRPKSNNYHDHLYKYVNNNMENIRRLNGKAVMRESLSIDDIYEIAQICASANNFQAAEDWLNGEKVSEFSTEKQLKCYEILTLANMYSGNLLRAHQTVKLSLDYKWDFGDRFTLYVTLKEKIGILSSNTWANNLVESYKVCAGDYEEEFNKKALKCWYRDYDIAYRKLAPFKYEQISEDPLVYIIRDMITDAEIERMKDETIDKLKPAEVQAEKGSVNKVDLHYRPCVTTFHDSPNHAIMLQKLEDNTGISRFNGEPLSILHYAPGGYYRTHSDFLGPQTYGLSTEGNRIATALFYFNDVELGGETAIPHLKLKVKPKKGSVLFWVNITKDRTEEVLTTHSACPVIIGEKFGATQWIREMGYPGSSFCYDIKLLSNRI